MVGSDHPTGRSALRTPSASTALGWAPWAGVRLPMHMNLPGNQNRSFQQRRERTPRARSPYIRGMRRSGPDDVLGGILACVLG